MDTRDQARTSRALRLSPLVAAASLFISSMIVSYGMSALSSSPNVRTEFWAKLLCQMARYQHLAFRGITLFALLIPTSAVIILVLTPPKERENVLQLAVPSILGVLGLLSYYVLFPNMSWGLSMPLGCAVL
jgi:hypothetical protein